MQYLIEGFKATSISLHSLTEDETENVVEHKVGASVRNEVEYLGVSLGVLLLVNEKLTSDHDNDITVSRGGLGIQSSDSVGHLLEGERSQLLNDVLSTLDLRGLKGQHGLISLKLAP